MKLPREVKEILETYKDMQSVVAMAEKLGCSWNRVVKILSSIGIIINNTHSVILNLHEKGLSATEIAQQTGYNIKTVQSYLPAVRPFYGINQSVNAMRIAKCRKKEPKK